MAEAQPRRTSSTDSTQGPYRFVTCDDLLSQPEPGWLINQVLVAGGLSVLYGPPGLGKSFLALDWACSNGSGRPWLGHDVQRGRVLYVAGEGTGGLGKRFAAWREVRGHNGPLDVNILSRTVPLIDPAEVRRFADSVQAQVEKPPVLTVFDTLARCFGGGDENSTKDMGLVVDT